MKSPIIIAGTLAGLMVVAFYIGRTVEVRSQADKTETAYRDGVMFGHRCVNANLNKAAGNEDAVKFFVKESKQFARFGWGCNASQSLLEQDYWRMATK